MSLVSTYVRADDGNLYRDPVIVIPGEGFICFDDDDPPELILLGNRREVEAKLILDSTGIKHAGLRRNRQSDRMFSGRMRPATSFFFDIIARIPASLIPDGQEPVHKRPFQGCFYDWPATTESGRTP